jgi:DNA-binding NarL/FixJ family response regulator
LNISTRENTVFELIARGFTDREVANQLSISIATARKHRENLLGKFQFTKSSQLATHYFRLNRDALKKTMTCD